MTRDEQSPSLLDFPPTAERTRIIIRFFEGSAVAETQIGSDPFEDHDQPSRPRGWIEAHPFNADPDSEFNPHQLGGLIKEVFDDFGILLTSDAVRFSEGDWTYQGEPPVACEDCGEQLHVYRRPFKAYGKEMRWWGIVCPGCAEIIEMKDLRSVTSKAIKVWDNPGLASGKTSSANNPQHHKEETRSAIGENYLVIIDFLKTVTGTDPLDESEFTSDRHRVYASKLFQDLESTRLIDSDGVIRAEWQTSDIKHISWREESSHANQVGPTPSEYHEKIAAIKDKFPNAYSPWTESDDANLREAVMRCLSVRQLSQQFQRQPGAITSRISKLGLVLQQPSTSSITD